MRIIVKATKLELTPAVREYIEKKMGGLAKFLKSFEKEGELEVCVEISRTTRHHHKGEVFYAEAMIYLPKKTLRAEEINVDVRTAIDIAKTKLQQEISKFKGKKIETQRKAE